MLATPLSNGVERGDFILDRVVIVMTLSVGSISIMVGVVVGIDIGGSESMPVVAMIVSGGSMSMMVSVVVGVAVLDVSVNGSSLLVVMELASPGKGPSAEEEGEEACRGRKCMVTGGGGEGI